MNCALLAILSAEGILNTTCHNLRVAFLSPQRGVAGDPSPALIHTIPNASYNNPAVPL
jgi:hypothetical protein